MGTNNMPPAQPAASIMGTASHKLCVRAKAGIKQANTTAQTLCLRARKMRQVSAAMTAPPITPNATRPCKYAPACKVKPACVCAHTRTKNCSTAPTPQLRVVTRKETPPKGSRHSFKLLAQKADQRISAQDHADCLGERKAYIPLLSTAEITYNRQITPKPKPIWVSTSQSVVAQAKTFWGPSAPQDPEPISHPPNTTPHKTESTTDTSRKALALTRLAEGTVSVSKPYFAGAYTEAAKPVRAKATKGLTPVHNKTTDTNLSKFIAIMTWRF